MDLNMRITRSRGGGMRMTPRDRPPTPRASGAASVLRTPSPNRTRGSASREPTTACDLTLDLLGSDPNDERVKGRSNKLLLTGC
jgi:hypothetical protein